MATKNAVRQERGIRKVGPNTYEVRVYLGVDPISGTKRTASRRIEGGIKAARQLRAEMLAQSGKKAFQAGSQTFSGLLDAWLNHIEVSGRSPSTISGYRYKIEATIRPKLGPLRLEEVTPHAIDSFYINLLKNEVSPATVNHYHRIIRAALSQGEKWGWVQSNAARLATPPRSAPQSLLPPSPEQVEIILKAAASAPNPELGTVIFLAATTGLRRGEISGLKWSDVMFETSTVSVRRSIWQSASQWGEKDPKSHQTRNLVIGEKTLGVLAGRFQRASALCSELGVSFATDFYVFSSDPEGKTPFLPDAITQAYRRLLEKISRERNEQWRFRFHDLRHFTATQLIRGGHSARTVADRLGHSDVAVTLRTYTHNTSDQAVDAAAAIEQGLSL